ncbi:AAA family ATPase [Pseudomonas fragi]|uniref:AAA family ATPase n=1 Tax=Pseudomonas fragi TaxID=296 RepID=UPI0014733A6B|nr:AAA family ATPase [Pseudomonas fragi]NNB27938.1 AAA family ATPase [Pseudomonas fragi]
MSAQGIEPVFPLYSTVNDTTPAQSISLARLRVLAANPSVGEKAKAQALTPYSADGKQKADALDAMYHAVVVDHDHDDLGRDAIQCSYDSFGVPFLAYTTTTHQRPDNHSVVANRWRVVIPLAAPVDAKQYQQLAQGIAQRLGTDAAQARTQQVFFAPNKADETAPYEFIDCTTQPFLNADDRQHPFVVNAIAGWQEIQRDKAAKAQSAKAKPRKLMDATQGSIIERVIQSHSLRDVLESNGYKRDGGDYLSPTSSSGNAGVHILERDGKEVCYSHHGESDPLSAMNNNGHALDVFDVLVILEHHGDMSAAVRALANKVDMEGQKERQREWAKAKAPEAISQAVDGFGAPQAITEDSSTVPFDLSQFSLNGKSQAMRSKMMADKYVLGRIAILGQATAIYAKPNSGKTLLTLHLLIESVAAGNINGADVFYINADDTYKGLVQKLELAEKYGFWMLAPGHGNFDSDMLLRILQKMIEEGTATGKVLILDTLKKFTDIMDKRVSSNFGKVMREFVSHGGTLIMLAHTNKNRDTNGKVVFSGTSDIVDDADCAYTLDATDTGSDTKTVLFENFKQRGDVAREVAYTYSTTEKQNYLDLLASVCELDEAKKQAHQDHARIVQMLERNTDIIEAITEALDSGVCLKTELIDQASKASGISKPKIGKVLDAHTGKEWQSGHRWYVTKAEKNAKIYHRLDVWAPKPKDDYQSAKDGE